MLTIVALCVLGIIFGVALVSELVSIGPGTVMKTLVSVSCVALIPIILQIYPSPLNGQQYAQVLRQPWLPTQVITLNNGKEFTGYVLSDAPGWVIVLKNADRRVVYYPDTDVTGRRLCRLGLTKNLQPLIAFTATGAGGPAIPVCPAS